MKLTALVLALVPFAAAAWDNLDYGIPGPCDQIIEREGYALGYSRQHGQPLWVAYRLTANEVTNRVVKHSGKFFYDPEIRTGTASPKDYAKSDYARGHLAPVADMRFGTNVMLQSFSMANVSPQWPQFNVGVWKRLEKSVRDMAVREGSVFVVTGPVFLAERNASRVAVNGILVPDAFYKVVLVEKPPLRMVGYVVPNESSSRKLGDFAVSVNEVEKMTGMDFFFSMPFDMQETLESQVGKPILN